MEGLEGGTEGKGIARGIVVVKIEKELEIRMFTGFEP